ncbi:MFS transporter [Chromobacterium haemolyticum]|uniref:MFS transporter n=1 Tax=Chromobacterium haemolyticum TaxID=394935 RepID=UPI0037BFC72B
MILKPMTTATAATPDQDSTRFRVLGAISFSHFLNDMLQSLLLAIYPLLKGNYQLSFAEIGLMTLTYQCTASLLQPLVGLYTDKKPMPYSLVLGMGATLCGLLLLSSAGSFPCCCWPRRWWAQAPRYFIRNRRGWPAWPPAAVLVWPNPFFRWEATPAAPAGRFWRR